MIIPDDYTLADIYERFTHILVLYDNDETGIRGSKNLCEYANTLTDDEAFTSYQYKNHKDSAEYYLDSPQDLAAELKFITDEITNNHTS